MLQEVDLAFAVAVAVEPAAKQHPLASAVAFAVVAEAFAAALAVFAFEAFVASVVVEVVAVAAVGVVVAAEALAAGAVEREYSAAAVARVSLAPISPQAVRVVPLDLHCWDHQLLLMLEAVGQVDQLGTEAEVP